MNCGHFTTTKLATTETYFATSGKLTIITYSGLLISFLNVLVTFLGCRIIIFCELHELHVLSYFTSFQIILLGVKRKLRSV